MSESSTQANPALTAKVVYQRPYGGEICSDIPYGNDVSQVMDIYYPENPQALTAAVILVTGLPDSGYQSRMGMKLKEVMWYISWSKLIAASGLIAITYSNDAPYEDGVALIKYLRSNCSELGIDSQRLGVISQSANVPNTLSLLMSDLQLKCAALLYGYMLDTKDSTLVVDALSSFGMPEPKTIGDKFPDDTPLLIVRAGKEQHPNLNESIDLFAAEALKRNSPLSLINYPEGVHCFDIFDSSLESILVIKRIVKFLRYQLGG